MAGLWAARSARAAGGARPRVVVLDGARRLGAKILVAGGGRCNVTHDVVDETAFAGSSRRAIRKVLGRFDVARTVAFFRELGVDLKREETGKLFPTTDSARTVLDALLGAVRDAGAELVHPWRVERVARRDGGGFEIAGPAGTLVAERIVLATGGKSLPQTGSDGAGYGIARSLGHSITERVFPALVPLLLPAGDALRALRGVSARATVEVRSSAGAVLARFTDGLLCTHFGVSGPAVLDASRYLTAARFDDPGARLVVSWLPGETPESADRALLARGAAGGGRFLRERGLPERLAEAICDAAGVPAGRPLRELARAERRALAGAATEWTLAVAGDRGFTHAEVTAGGVPLSEIRLETMESRPCPGLHVVGEVCDVDGRIGGYNFQWAWASGYVAGRAAGAAALRARDSAVDGKRAPG